MPCKKSKPTCASRAEALDKRERTGARLAVFQPRLLEQKVGDDPVDHLQHGREQLRMCREEDAQRERERQHPLTHGRLRDDVIDQMGGGCCHAPGAAGGTKAASLDNEKATSFSWAHSAQRRRRKP